MKTTDVPVLPPGLAQILQEFPGCVIAGSWPLAHLVDTKVDWEPADIDLFVDDALAWPPVLSILMATGWKYQGNSEPEQPSGKYPKNGINFIQNFTNPKSKWPLQIVFTKFHCSTSAVWDSFDLSICEVGIYWDIEVGDLVLATSDRFDVPFPEKLVTVLPTPPLDAGVHRRIRKYAERGFNPFSIGSFGLVTIVPTVEGFDGFAKGWKKPTWQVKTKANDREG